MEPKKDALPREAIDAYNLFIHGEIDRRAFMDRIKKVAVSTAAAGRSVSSRSGQRPLLIVTTPDVFPRSRGPACAAEPLPAASHTR